MAVLDIIKDKLEKLYLAAVFSDISRLDFLRALSAYIAFTKDDPLLKKLIVSVREDAARESMDDIKKAVHDPVYRKILEMDVAYKDMADVPSKEFWLFAYSELEDASEAFSFMKDARDENEFSMKKVIREKKAKIGLAEYIATDSGKIMLVYAEHMYPEHLNLVHEKILEQLDQVKAHGLFSKYLDYDSSKGVLHFQDKEIRINMRKTLSNAHYLLAYLFTHDPFHEHFYDELEDAEALQQERPWKSYYDACIDIQKKVKDVAGIDDFLEFSTGKGMYVRLNPAYSLD